MYRSLGFRNGAKLDEIHDRHKDHVWIFYSTEHIDHLILVNMISAVFISTLLLILVFITIQVHGDSILWYLYVCRGYQYESNVIMKKADYWLNRCVKLTSLVTRITDWFGFNSSYLIHSNSGQFHSNSNLDSTNSFNSFINRRY